MKLRLGKDKLFRSVFVILPALIIVGGIIVGIAGIVRFKGGIDPETTVKKMLRSLQHRGPDEHGLWHNGSISIGTARLAILDLMTGNQPIANEDQTVWVSLNGEIYNFPDLRERLIAKAYSPISMTEAESVSSKSPPPRSPLLAGCGTRQDHREMPSIVFTRPASLRPSRWTGRSTISGSTIAPIPIGKPLGRIRFEALRYE